MARGGSTHTVFETISKTLIKATTHRRLIAWACALALLLQGLGPVGQVLAAEADASTGTGVPSVQYICTAFGIKAVPFDVGQPAPSPVNVDSGDTCPFCQVHAAAAVLPERAGAVSFAPTVLTRLAPKSAHFVLASTARAPIPPRGPPSLFA